MDGATQDDQGTRAPRVIRPTGGRAWDALFVAAGALAIVVQVTFLRELMVALSGDETAIGLGLAAWLAGITAGAALARSRTGRARFATLCFALLAVAGPIGIVGGRFLRLAISPPPGEILPLGSSFLFAVAILAPAGALVGATFTSLAAAVSDAGIPPGRGIARLYVVESLGSLAGGALQTFVLIPLLPPLRGVTLAAAACIFVALPVVIAPRGPRLRGRVLWIGLAAVLLALSLPAVGEPFEEASGRARFAGLAPGIPLLRAVDTPYQHIAVGGDGVVRHLYAAGQYAGSFPDPIQSEPRAHILASLAAHPRRILAIGGVEMGPLRFLLRHPVERIDVPEPDRRAVDLLRAVLDRDDARALEDPRVRIVHDDPRRFLAQTAQRYDLILILKPDPVTLFLARLTTLEFYRLCAARLEEEGVIVVGLRTAPNVLTGETAAMAGAVFGALRRVFPVVRAGPGPDGILVAGRSATAVILDPVVLAARFRERGIGARAFVPEMFPVLFPPARVQAQEAALARAAEVTQASEDDRPVSFIHALARRQAITGGGAGRLLSRLAALPGWALVLAALAPSALALARSLFSQRRHTAAPSIHVATATGACGMVWSLLLIFSFQTRAGALYGDLGLLTAAFMLGLAAGGVAGYRAASARPEGSRTWLLRTGGAACAFALVVAGILHVVGGWPALTAVPAIISHAALLLAAGGVTGAVFPSAVGARLSAGSGAREAAGAIEAADHAGATVAALFAALLFVPRFGLVGSAVLVAGVEACAVAATWVTKPDPGDAPPR